MSTSSFYDKHVEKLEKLIEQDKLIADLYEQFIQDIREKAESFKESDKVTYDWYLARATEQEKQLKRILRKIVGTYKKIERRISYHIWRSWF